MFAKKLIDEGKLGRIFHYRAKFLQDWTISADLPQGGAGLWRLDVAAAGSGVTGDLLAHCIDTALWLNGPIDSVNAMTETFAPNWQEGQWSAFRDEDKKQSGMPLPCVADWRKRLAVNVSPSSARSEIKAFEAFRQTMRSFLSGSPFELPTTTWRNISPWRIFCHLYPGSLDMLSAYLRDEHHWKKSIGCLGTAFNLVSTLANSEDHVMMERAKKIMNKNSADEFKTATLSPDEPITLAEACRLFSCAKLTVSTLRAEASRGRLSIFKIGRRDYTTVSEMNAMVSKCRDDDRRYSSIAKSNLSETQRATSAMNAVSETISKLKAARH